MSRVVLFPVIEGSLTAAHPSPLYPSASGPAPHCAHSPVAPISAGPAFPSLRVFEHGRWDKGCLTPAVYLVYGVFPVPRSRG